MSKENLIREFYCHRCERNISLIHPLKPGIKNTTVLKSMGWKFYPNIDAWVCPDCANELKENNETLKKYVFTSSTEVFAGNETEAKDKFADNSVNFAVNADIVEVIEGKEKLSNDNEEILIEYFYIYLENINTPPMSWKLDGDLFFSNKSELEKMRKELKQSFESIYDGKVKIWTDVEIKKISDES